LRSTFVGISGVFSFFFFLLIIDRPHASIPVSAEGASIKGLFFFNSSSD
jgi:hypothetical protein